MFDMRRQFDEILDDLAQEFQGRLKRGREASEAKSLSDVLFVIPVHFPDCFNNLTVLGFWNLDHELDHQISPLFVLGFMAPFPFSLSV